MKKLKLKQGDRISVQGYIFKSHEFTEVPDDFPEEQFKEILTDKDIVKLQEPKVKKTSKKKLEEIKEEAIDKVEEENIDPELID